MALPLKKIKQETKELDSYLKKAGLNSTALSLVETLAKGSGNDNQQNHDQSLAALNDFFAKKQKKQAEENNKEAENKSENQSLENVETEEAEMVQAFETVTHMIKTIQDQELEHAEAQSLLLQAEALMIVENQGLETLETMALKQMRAEITDNHTEFENQENFDRLHSLNHAVESQRDTNVRCDAMAITYVASKANQDPEVQAQENPAVQLALDIQEKDQAPEALESELSEEVPSDDNTKTIEEARNDGDRIYVTDNSGRYDIITDVKTIKTLNEVAVDKTAEFHDAMPELVQDAFKSATKETLDVVKNHKNLRMVGATNGVGGGFYDIKPQ